MSLTFQNAIGNEQIVSTNNGPLAGLRNKLINGNFDVWQRATNFSSPSATYTADRWSIDVDNLSAVWSVGKVGSQQDATDQGTTGVMRFAVTTLGSLTYADIGQKIENVATLQNQIATVSFLHRFGTTVKNIYVYIEQNFGVGGSASVITTVANTQLGSADAGFTKISGTITIPAVSGKTIGANSFLRVIIRIFAPAAGDYCDITKVQFESGSVATPFEARPYGLELALCQRYYQNARADFEGYMTSPNSVIYNYALPVLLRATPTITLLTTGSLGGVAVAPTVNVYEQYIVSFSSAFTATGVGFFVGYRYSLSAEL